MHFKGLHALRIYFGPAKKGPKKKVTTATLFHSYIWLNSCNVLFEFFSKCLLKWGQSRACGQWVKGVLGCVTLTNRSWRGDLSNIYNLTGKARGAEDKARKASALTASPRMLLNRRMHVHTYAWTVWCKLSLGILRLDWLWSGQQVI